MLGFEVALDLICKKIEQKCVSERALGLILGLSHQELLVHFPRIRQVMLPQIQRKQNARDIFSKDISPYKWIAFFCHIWPKKLYSLVKKNM